MATLMKERLTQRLTAVMLYALAVQAACASGTAKESADHDRTSQTSAERMMRGARVTHDDAATWDGGEYALLWSHHEVLSV